MDDPMTDDPSVPSDADAIPVDEQATSGVLGRIGLESEPAPEPLPSLETEPEPRLDVLAAVQAMGDRIERRLMDLQGVFEREVRAEATREKMVDRLHAELQESKQDLLLNMLRPVFIDLIQLHDDIGKVAVCPETADETVRRLVSLMHGFQQGVEDILYRQGVEPFETEGDIFDPRRQRAITTVPTDDPARNKIIAARLRKGFQARDKVIRPEVVSVYAHKK
jgi:molecular chaperone GrpE